ncbi:hypothetical protein ACFYXQ_46785 [Nocardia jiangxiensis]|uniref:Uncharacterized protein n=1 Tax=Nocardia jiangxiensis TaxID=282685 RepID=A0ABW6SFZ6_9NOCA
MPPIPYGSRFAAAVAYQAQRADGLDGAMAQRGYGDSGVGAVA